MVRQRKLHLGSVPIGGKALKSRRKAREVTSQFHNIRNELEALKAAKNLSRTDRQSKEADLRQKLDLIGGIDAYQQASVISTSHFQTSKWIAKTINSLKTRFSTKEESKEERIEGKSGNGTIAKKRLKVLEVGAINTQLSQYSNLDVRAIDLHSQHPLIEECDFFTIEPKFNFDVVVCSMVINCVTHPTKRGEMLIRLMCHLRIPHGVLFLVLPRRCIASPFVGEEEFLCLLDTLGLQLLLPKRETPKVVFYVLGLSAARCPAIVEEGVADELKDWKMLGNSLLSELVISGDGRKVSGWKSKNGSECAHEVKLIDEDERKKKLQRFRPLVSGDTDCKASGAIPEFSIRLPTTL